MTPTEIIKADAESHNVDAMKVLRFVGSVVQSKRGTLISAGNSILLIVNIGNHNAELHLYTVDSPMQLMKVVPKFIDSIRQTPIKHVYGKADNEGIVQMLSRLGVNVQHSDLPQYNWMAQV